MSKCKLNIWGREFELTVEYDCYSNEEILPIQKEALQSFTGAELAIDAARDSLEKYCLEHNAEDIGADHIENIFKYVVPKYLYVKREESRHVVAIMCNYKFDMENGIAVVFENEQVKKIGKQDIVL